MGGVTIHNMYSSLQKYIKLCTVASCWTIIDFDSKILQLLNSLKSKWKMCMKEEIKFLCIKNQNLKQTLHQFCISINYTLDQLWPLIENSTKSRQIKKGLWLVVIIHILNEVWDWNKLPLLILPDLKPTTTQSGPLLSFCHRNSIHSTDKKLH